MSRPKKGKSSRSELYDIERKNREKTGEDTGETKPVSKTQQQKARGCVLRIIVIVVAIFILAYLIYSQFN